jgi:hypothetical protein
MRAALAVAWLAAAPAAEAAACHLAMTDIPVTMHGTRPLLDAKIDGHDMRLLADSGASISLLSPETAKTLGLFLRPLSFGFELEGVGGGVAPLYGVVRRFELAGAVVPNVVFAVGGSESGDEAAGIVGQNLWHVADDDYDLANGMIRLVRPSGCGGASLAYWDKDGSASMILMDTLNPRDRRTASSAAINGTTVSVLFDTGASASVLTYDAARRAGVDPFGPNTRPGGRSRGIGPRTVETRIAIVDSFAIGNETISHAKLRLVNERDRSQDMLLGADFFLSHHVYVANSQGRIYFTYNGGPVFSLEPQRADAPDASTP